MTLEYKLLSGNQNYAIYIIKYCVQKHKLLSQYMGF